MAKKVKKGFGIKEVVLIIVLAGVVGILAAAFAGPIGAFVGFWGVIYAFYRKEKEKKAS
jgi:hypothetical protein